VNASKEFRARISKSLDLESADAVWLGVLDQVCAILDRIDEIRAELAKNGLTISGSKGQVALHPLLAEERQQRLAAARLMERLGLDEQETQSDRQRRYANARWHR
jgi:phage terminase small subunit